ncbi:hypothetical protein [Priestia taiwanensis]|uniref:hypothetical protein n=1 Tax=Priestia taiwanensis TaxID=1347902 RepID=UPI0016641F81|nr:hypothetical protein [Priestia taiwanensis]MBM7364592.1 hypothetical protein [Priestia taiwanensis]
MRTETKVKQLIRATCAGYTTKGGNCLYKGSCPFFNEQEYRDKTIPFESKRCSYFETHVLPGDTELHAIYFNDNTQSGKVCVECSGHFITTGNRAKYCDGCRERVRKRQIKESVRNYRKRTG